MNRHNQSVSDNVSSSWCCLLVAMVTPVLQEIGVGNTCAWKVCGLDPSTTLAVVFEVS